MVRAALHRAPDASRPARDRVGQAQALRAEADPRQPGLPARGQRGRAPARRADRAGLPADRRAHRGDAPARRPRGARPRREPPTPSTCRRGPSTRGAASRRSAARSRRPTSRRPSRRATRRSTGWPSTSCSRSRSGWSGGDGSGGADSARPVGGRRRDRCASCEPRSRAPSVGSSARDGRADAGPGRRDPGHPGRHRQARRRCSGCSRATSAPARRPSRRTRSPPPRAPACRERSSRRRTCWRVSTTATLTALLEDADLPVELLTGSLDRRVGSPDAGARRVRHGPDRRRDPRAAPGSRRVRRVGAGGDRRAAPLRRRAARSARGQGRRRSRAARAADDRDADPADPRAGALRRPRRLEPADAAGGPVADPDRHPAPGRARRHVAEGPRRGGRRPPQLRRRPADRRGRGGRRGTGGGRRHAAGLLGRIGTGRGGRVRAAPGAAGAAPGRDGPRPDEGGRPRRRDGPLPRRRDRGARRDDGRRGRRRRARGDDDGDPGRRPVRARAAPPAARPRRARRGGVVLRARLRLRRTRPPRPGSRRSPSCTTGSSWPSGTGSCAARATCSGLVQSGLPRLRVASLQRTDHRELAVKAARPPRRCSTSTATSAPATTRSGPRWPGAGSPASRRPSRPAPPEARTGCREKAVRDRRRRQRRPGDRGRRARAAASSRRGPGPGPSAIGSSRACSRSSSRRSATAPSSTSSPGAARQGSRRCRAAPASVVFVEHNAAARAVIERNLADDEPGRAAASRSSGWSVAGWLAGIRAAASEPSFAPFGSSSLDPPYDEPAAARPGARGRRGGRPGAVLAADGVAVAKHFWETPPSARIGLLRSSAKSDSARRR